MRQSFYACTRSNDCPACGAGFTAESWWPGAAGDDRREDPPRDAPETKWSRREAWTPGNDCDLDEDILEDDDDADVSLDEIADVPGEGTRLTRGLAALRAAVP